MKLFLYAIAGILFLYTVYLCSFSALNGELIFSNDVARDFLLLQELDAKKIVLIGPRSSTTGLFYSSFFTYLNYPSYLIGGGNPVTVAWFWVGLCLLLFITSFFMVKKMFGLFPAIIYVLIIGAKVVPESSSIFEPMAMYFVMPAFIFTIIRYFQTKKLSYLVFHIITLAVFIHLSIGIGLQFLILSAPVIFYIVYKHKKWKHLFAFLILPLGIANLIIFDLRHNLVMAKALFATGEATKFFVTIPDWIANRVNNLISLQLLDRNDNLLLLIFIAVMFFTILEIKKDKKLRPIYILFVFYYFGYIMLSYFNKGILLFHYMFLIIPFTVLWLVSFLNGKYKAVFIPIVLIVYILNLQYAIDYTRDLKNSYMGKAQDSWKGLSRVAQGVIDMQKGKEFGYYVFAPDSFAYQPRYAMIYNFKKANAKAFEYTKKDTTIVIAQPPPKNDIYMDYKWWVKVPVKITKDPEKIIEFPNGYKALEYNLTEEEQKIPHDKAIELGIHFR